MRSCLKIKTVFHSRAYSMVSSFLGDWNQTKETSKKLLRKFSLMWRIEKAEGRLMWNIEIYVLYSFGYEPAGHWRLVATFEYAGEGWRGKGREGSRKAETHVGHLKCTEGRIFEEICNSVSWPSRLDFLRYSFPSTMLTVIVVVLMWWSQLSDADFFLTALRIIGPSFFLGLRYRAYCRNFPLETSSFYVAIFPNWLWLLPLFQTLLEKSPVKIPAFICFMSLTETILKKWILALEIIDARPEHSGIWTCEAENDAGKAELEFNVDIWS